MADPSAVASIRRRLDHLDRNPTLLQPQDAPALRALEARITSMRAHTNIAQSSLPAELDQLLVRTQRLSRKATRQQQSYDGDDSSDDDDGELGSGFSAASIARRLQESIASQSIATIMLPPTRKLVVNEDPPAGMDDASQEKRRLALEQQDDDIAEYEQGAAALRKRQGYASKEGDDGGRGVSEKPPSYSEKDKSSSTSTTTQQPLLSTERTTQEALSTELLRMASILRSQTVSFSSALERDRKLLESADEKLVQNMDVMTRTRGKLGEYAHTARGMGWFTLGTVLMVVMTWVVMFVVIKLT